MAAMMAGGCGDGLGGPTAFTKFANSFLANQQMHSEWQRPGLEAGLAELGNEEQLGLPLLGDGSQDARLLGLRGDGGTGSLETEFLQEFHPDFESEWQLQANEGGQASILGGAGDGMTAIKYVLDSFADALARGPMALVPQLPRLIGHPQALSPPEKLGAVRQVTDLLSSHGMSDQSMFDAFLAEAVRALCIEPEVLEEAALEDEWEQAQEHREEQEALLEEGWVEAQQQQQHLQHQHEAEAALLEEEFQQCFDPVAQQAAQWEQELHDAEAEAEMEAEYREIESNAASQQNLTPDERLRVEEAAWYSQFVVGGAPDAQAASWIDEFLELDGPGASSSLGGADDLLNEFLAEEAGPAAAAQMDFRNSVRNLADQIGQVPDRQVRSSELLRFLNGVADSSIDINALPEQSFFPS